MKAVKQDAAFDQARRLNKYEMALSRGASHIASTLYEESMLAAVREVILHFEASHGRDDLKAFASAVSQKTGAARESAGGQGAPALF
ncbi:hypothetical protein B0G69_3359 [Paraburkholderia sp. RAU2J]|uniref:hypothetical protein n=1 Tax=Paraburkholderia sp. RAU2J TaxID=1938810 RepID=UPI000EAC7C91|nr:hypothetical protein [Paraburkholderia sp. RAU2J]RKT27533.1 hypothetical protein B0G69_3359 [Paraburkholderia sp. RAU2J]